MEVMRYSIELPLTHNFPPNSFKVKVATREGWYIPNLNETWLPWSHDRKKRVHQYFLSFDL